MMKFLLSLSLIQAQLGCIPIQDFTLTQDTSKIFRNGSRITRCMYVLALIDFQYFTSKLVYSIHIENLF